MKLNLKEFMQETGITEPFYPGKRLVKACRQPGDFKSHCVVFDWRDPAKIVVEVKAGLSGKSLPVAQIREYPVSFQSPTFVEIEMLNDNEEDEEGKGRAGGSGGGMKKKKLSDLNGIMAKAFSDISEGRIPERGEVTRMVVMGMEIAKEAMAAVMTKFCQQIEHSRIAATDLLAQAGNFITRYTPPAFMQPKGDEDKTYKYDRNKNEDIGMRGPALG